MTVIFVQLAFDDSVKGPRPLASAGLTSTGVLICFYIPVRIGSLPADVQLLFCLPLAAGEAGAQVKAAWKTRGEQTRAA